MDINKVRNNMSQQIKCDEAHSHLARTLYAECLLERVQTEQEKGGEYVNFVDVDDLVIAKSKKIIKWEYEEDLGGEKE